MKKVAVIYGTRPEAIKVAPVIKELQAHPDLQPVLINTGQHTDMLQQVNDWFGLTPEVNLQVFQQGSSLAELSARILTTLDPALAELSPDAILVQGDTTTVAMGAVAAFYRQIPVVHLEAGLRSGNIKSPFPEEANRRLTGQVTDLHLAPTAASRHNLENEGIAPDLITVTGNTVIDALHWTANQKVRFQDERLNKLLETDQEVLLVTTHRRENWGEPMAGIGRALAQLAKDYPQLQIVFPAHKNPLVREAIRPTIQGLQNVLMIEPLSYPQFVALEKRSRLVLTDSGGVQEEAPGLGKPVLVLRENTERPEAVEYGTVKLIGTDENRIVTETHLLLDNPAEYAKMAQAFNPYGDGQAAKRSVAAIAQLLGIGQRLAEFTTPPLQA